MCVLPILLYGSECWAISNVDGRRLDVLDQRRCLRRLLGIKRYRFVSNAEMWRTSTSSESLTSTIEAQHLFLSGTLHDWMTVMMLRDPDCIPTRRLEDTAWTSSDHMDEGCPN